MWRLAGNNVLSVEIMIPKLWHARYPGGSLPHRLRALPRASGAVGVGAGPG